MYPSLDVEHAVNDRYGKAAHQREQQLCCPIEYDSKLLDVIPKEIKEKDYGCGDPTPFVRQGDVVLDLGSGIQGMREPRLLVAHSGDAIHLPAAARSLYSTLEAVLARPMTKFHGKEY